MVENRVEWVLTWSPVGEFEVESKDYRSDPPEIDTLMKIEDSRRLTAGWPAVMDYMERALKSLMGEINKDLQGG